MKLCFNPTFHARPPPSPIFSITFSLSSRHTPPSPTCAEPGRLGCPPCPRSARLHRNPQSCPSTCACPMHASRPIPHFFCCVRGANKAPAPHQPPSPTPAKGLPPLPIFPWCCRRWEPPSEEDIQAEGQAISTRPKL